MFLLFCGNYGDMPRTYLGYGYYRYRKKESQRCKGEKILKNF